MSYRPYAAPTAKPIMYQSWHDLLFMHWPVATTVLRPYIPQALEIDTFENQAWIAVVPFRMSNIYPRGLFPVPYLSAFPELNVRTYVIKDSKPGVWFFSLEAANPIAVSLARRFFKLPYFNANMQCINNHEHFSYSSFRTHKHAPYCEFRAGYEATNPPFIAAKGSLEYFLTARYCLYTSDQAGKLYRGEIDHEPWQLQKAQAAIEANTMTANLQIALESQPLLHFSKSIDVRIWGLETVQ